MQNETRERLVDLLEQAEGQVNNDYPTVEMVADYLITNGVLLPPCNVGDTVYYIRFGEIIESVVSCVSFTKSNIHFETWENPYFKSFELYNIGVVVFLTKAEAEQKLKEMRADNDL